MQHGPQPLGHFLAVVKTFLAQVPYGLFVISYLQENPCQYRLVVLVLVFSEGQQQLLFGCDYHRVDLAFYRGPVGQWLRRQQLTQVLCNGVLVQCHANIPLLDKSRAKKAARRVRVLLVRVLLVRVLLVRVLLVRVLPVRVLLVRVLLVRVLLVRVLLVRVLLVRVLLVRVMLV